MTARPQRTLDARFGDSDAVAIDWDTVARALDEAPLFWITTVRRDGSPHVTPLVAVWVGDALHFCTGVDEQKNCNIATNPHVVLTTGCNQWDGGLDLVVEGEAVEVRDQHALQDLADAWAHKWDGRWQFDVADGSFAVNGSHGAPLVYRVAPAKVIAFGKNPFSQTTFRP